MTDNEIIKALELCIRWEEGDCLLCPLQDVEACTYEIEILALDLINRQREEIERLQSVNADMQESLRLAAEANKGLQAEVDRYKKYYETMEIEVYSFRKDQAEVKFLENKIRAEAIKEFADGLTKKIFPTGCLCDGNYSVNAKAVKTVIDNLVKEMTEEKK